MDGIATKTAKNIFWNYGSFVANKSTVFITTIILARILSPDDFGLVAIALIILEYLENFNRFGIDTAMIYQQGDYEKISNTAFVIALVSGFFLMLLAILGAPLVGSFFNEPRAIALMQVMALSLFLTNLQSIHQARLMKGLDFKRRAIPEVSQALVKGTASIILALSGFGVWSLVWGRIIGIIWSSFAYWYVERWIPNFSFDRALASSMIRYGVQIILISLQATVFNNIDYLIVGRQLGSEQLGYYSMAYKMPELLIIGLVIIVGQTLFPTYVKFQDDLSLMKKGYLTVLSYASIFTIPVGLGLMLTAHDFVLLVYSEIWQPAIPATQILAVYAIIYALTYNDVFKAIGRPDIVTRIAFVRILILVPTLLYAVQFGITQVAFAQLAANILVMLITFGATMRTLKVSIKEILLALHAPLISGLIMVALVLLVQHSLPSLPIWFTFFLTIIIGALVYTASLYILARELFLSMLTMAKKMFKK